MHRKFKIAFAALALSAGFAGQAQAATSTVRLHTAADTTKSLSDTPSGVTSMNQTLTSDLNQKWRKTDTNSGYATYTNVATGRCLTGRSLQGFPVVTAEKCIVGATKQQWKLGVSGDFQLRLNGLVAKHNTAGNGSGVLMSLFTAQSNQKWHSHAA